MSLRHPLPGGKGAGGNGGAPLAKRLNPRHQQMVRDKIQTVQLIKRLQDHVDGEVELSPTQCQSAQFLIGMSLAKPAQDVHHEHDGELVIRWKS